jgi:diadenosine tetraphosphate (Ap4A) HIT family hydrolase
MNYEIHGNTIPHLHMHLYPRYSGDPFEGEPIDPRRVAFERSADELHRLGAEIARGSLVQ